MAPYSEAVAANGIAICEQLGVTRLDTGLVIHTAPESPQPALLIGYADAAGPWNRTPSPEHQVRPAAADQLTTRGPVNLENRKAAIRLARTFIGQWAISGWAPTVSTVLTPDHDGTTAR